MITVADLPPTAPTTPRRTVMPLLPAPPRSRVPHVEVAGVAAVVAVTHPHLAKELRAIEFMELIRATLEAKAERDAVNA